MSTADAPTQQVRRLTRPQDGRIVAGVCGAVARYLDIDPVIPRVILAVLAVFGGVGVVVYAAAWLLLPEDGEATTRFEEWLSGRHGRRRRDLAIVAVVLVFLVIVVGHDPLSSPLSGAAVVILLIMGAAALYGRRTTAGIPFLHFRARTVAGYDAGPQPEPAQPTWSPATGWSDPAPPWDQAPAWVPPLPRQRRPRSVLGWLILGAALLVVGGFSLVGLTGAADPQPADVIAAAVAVVGVGLLVGAVRGRAWLMIPIGLLLVMLLGVAAAIPRDLTWSSGTRDWTPAASGASATYILGAGKADLDLTGLAPTAGTSITSRIGAGRLIVFVPRGREIIVDAKASAGRLSLFGHEFNGTGLHERWTLAPAATIGPPVHLTLRAGFADVEVRNA